MAEQDLIEQIGFTCKLFVSIFLFGIVGLIIAYSLNLDAIISYKIIIGSALIGSFRSIWLVLERF